VRVRKVEVLFIVGPIAVIGAIAFSLADTPQKRRAPVFRAKSASALAVENLAQENVSSISILTHPLRSMSYTAAWAMLLHREDAKGVFGRDLLHRREIGRSLTIGSSELPTFSVPLKLPVATDCRGSKARSPPVVCREAAGGQKRALVSVR
jgi:hypothetical protein